MKKRLASLIVALAVFMGAGMALSEDIASAQDDRDYAELFEKDAIMTIEINIADEDLANIYANPLLEEYHSANITVNGVTVENAGIRTKGNSSLSSVARSDTDRYSFRIKFNKYVKGQKLLGLDEMVINNMFADPSYMREYMSYEAMREAGMDVPLTAFANIYINGELKGFYLCVEALEDSFLKRTQGDNDGNLYKQEMGSTLVYKENSEYTGSELKVGDDTEKTGLKNMIKILNEGGDIESILDIDSALGYIAANTVLGSYDSYSGQMAQNYYLYERTDGKFLVIPWDYNMSFGGFGQGGSGTSVSLDTPVSGVSMESRPLINNLLSIPAYKEKYLEYVCIFADYLERMPERADELATLIRPYVEADPTKFVTMEQFENSIVYADEEERESQGFGGKGDAGFGGMPGGFGGQMFEGLDQETIQAAMEIVRTAGTEGLNEKQIQQLRDLGLSDEQIEQFKSMGQRGGQRPDGQMPNGEGGQNEPDNGRGNMGGMPDRQMPEGMVPPNGAGMQGEQDGSEGMTPPSGAGMPERQDRFEGRGGGMGMSGGSIITFAVRRLANIQEQLGDGVTVLLDGEKMDFDVQPMIEDGRVLVPLRSIFETLGMEVEYDNGRITASKEGLIIKLTVDSSIAYANVQQYELDVPSRIKNDRTLVPLRFIGEATGLTVNYDASTKTVTMVSHPF